MRVSEVHETRRDLDAVSVPALSVDGSPALAVRQAILCFLPRRPDLVISGINYGENVGGSVTISGTVGAAIEAASYGVPTLAAALETEPKYHQSQSVEVDFTVSAAFVRRISTWILVRGMPPSVDILKLDVPWAARTDTPIRVTRVSRHPYWISPVTTDQSGRRRLHGYVREVDLSTLEPDSDIYALAVDHIVSLSPMTIDLTASVSLDSLSDLSRL
jgi:5'-nucleotidase